MAKNKPVTILGVSLSPVDQGSVYYAEAAAGRAEAHIIHYGESSFVTVFTDKAPQESMFSLHGLVKVLRAARGEDMRSHPSEEDKELMAFVAGEACEERGLDTEGQVFYLQAMSPEDAQRFAEKADSQAS